VVIRWLIVCYLERATRHKRQCFSFVVAGSSHTVLVVVVIGGIVKGVPFW
jgi:chorismate synthase